MHATFARGYLMLEIMLIEEPQETWRPHLPILEQRSILKTPSRLIGGHGQRA